MSSTPLQVPKPLSFVLVHALMFFAFLFLGLISVRYSFAQKPPKKPTKQSFWILFDAQTGWDSCSPRDIYLMDQKGEHVKKLTSDHRSHNPSWSPDGRRIVFLKDECKPVVSSSYTSFDVLRNFLNARRDVYRIDADGRNSSLISRIGPEAQDALWIPDGDRLGVRVADRSSLVVEMKGSRLPPSGRPEELLSQYFQEEGDWYRKQYCETSESAFGTTYPITAYCPGGGRLMILIPPADNFLPAFYGSHGLNNFGRWNLAKDMRYNADLGTSLRVISLEGDSTTSPVSAYDSAWSRDGMHIAYSSFSGDQNSILYSADLNGDGAAEPRALTGPELDAHGPAWSADGSRIAFAGLWKDSSQVFIINTDGSNLIQLSHDPKMRCSHASWSPDGGWIAAGCSPNVTIVDGDAYVSDSKSDIYLFDVTKPGTKPHRLTGCGHNGQNDLCGARNPSFAPAGPTTP